MAFNENGWRDVVAMGTPDNNGAAGTNRAWHTYISAEDAPAIETANFFNAKYQYVKDGDMLDVVFAVGGTISRRGYVLTRVGGNVVLTGENKTAGAGLQTLAFHFNLVDIGANGDLLTNYVPGYAFKIESIDWRTSKPVTTAAKSATFNLEINVTDVTGGVLALTSANATPAGAAVAGTAITAANVGTATDSFSIEATNVTAFAEGSGWLLVKIRNLET